MTNKSFEIEEIEEIEEELEEEWDAEELEHRLGWMDAKSENWGKYQNYKAADHSICGFSQKFFEKGIDKQASSML